MEPHLKKREKEMGKFALFALGDGWHCVHSVSASYSIQMLGRCCELYVLSLSTLQLHKQRLCAVASPNMSVFCNSSCGSSVVAPYRRMFIWPSFSVFIAFNVFKANKANFHISLSSLNAISLCGCSDEQRCWKNVQKNHESCFRMCYFLGPYSVELS